MDQNDFAERLRRIEEHQAEQPALAADSPIQTVNPRKTFALLACITGFVLLLGVGGMMVASSGKLNEFRESISASVSGLKFEVPNVGEKLLLSAAANAENNARQQVQEKQAELAAARATTLVAPPRDPYPAPATEPVVTDRMGLVFGPAHATNGSATPVPVETIMAGFQPTGPDSPHGAISFVEANEECRIRPVSAGEKMVSVNINTSDVTAPFQLLTAEGIDINIAKHVDEALEEGHALGMMPVYRGSLAATDVFVTDTSGPLYLLLQSNGRMLWHIHAAPEVDIAHIAIISGGTTALTGNIGNATQEMLRAGDFGARIDFFHYSGKPGDAECPAYPYRQPNESWGAWAGANGGNTMDGNLLFGQDQGFKHYDHWLQQSLGPDTNPHLIHADRASKVLVGPAPATPFNAPDTVQPVYTTAFDLILTGTAAAREEELISMVTERVNAAAGGDYRDVTPAPMDFATDLDAIAPTVIGERDFGDRMLGNNEIERMVSLAELNDDRRVNVTTEIHLSDLLNEGEALPVQEMRLTFAKMRAPNAMMAFCADTLIEIASKCGVHSTEVRELKDDIYQIRTTFAYIPNYQIGTVERRNNGSFLSAFLPDTFSESTHQTPEERRAFLVTMKDVCEQLRAEYGNCLIGVSGFNLNKPSRYASGVEAHAAGWVEVYLVDNPFEESKLEERAQAILAELQE